MTAQQPAVLSEIAQRVLGLETLETRNSDSQDFTDQAVWNIRAARDFFSKQLPLFDRPTL